MLPTTRFFAGRCLLIGAFTLAIAAATAIAHAAPAIDFNSLPASANNAQVQSYLQQQLTAAGYGGTVTVTGAVGGNGYTGEGHVVGPGTGSGVTSLTLGTLDGGNFIMNDKDHGASQITMAFSQPIYGAKFDFEIFPNGNVPDGRNVNPNNYPDFTFKASLNSQLVTTFKALGVMPGAPNPYMPGSPSTYLNSPAHSPEFAPQLLVTGLDAFLFPGGVNYLQFIDWPPRIGIDNLTLLLSPPITPSSTTPEPASLLAFGVVFGTLGVARFVRRRR